MGLLSLSNRNSCRTKALAIEMSLHRIESCDGFGGMRLRCGWSIDWGEVLDLHLLSIRDAAVTHALSVSVANIIVVAGDFQSRAAQLADCNASRPLLGQDDMRVGIVPYLPGPEICISIITTRGIVMASQLTLHTCLSARTVTLR